MTIATTNIGTAGAIALGVSASVGAGGVPSGSLIVVCIQDTTVGAATGSVADTAGNTYTLIASKSPNNSSTNGAAQMFYAWNSSALSSGNSITYTGTDASRSKSISAFYATGIQTSSDPLDTAVTVTGSSAVASPSALVSGTPAVAGELFVACLGRNNPTGAVFSQDTTHGWATPPNAASEGSGSPHSGINGGSQVNAGTSTISWQPTFNTGANSGSIVAGFKPDTGGGSRTLSGALTLGALSASGSLAVRNRISGALSLGALTATGSLKVAHKFSGALALGSLSASGSLKTANRVSGALSLGALAVSGSFSVHSAGAISGALHLGPLTTNGSLKVKVSTHGALTLGPLSLSGTLLLPRHVSGSITLGPMTITGSILSGSGPVIDHGTAQRVGEQVLSPRRPRTTTLSPRNARITSLSPSRPRRPTLTGRG